MVVRHLARRRLLGNSRKARERERDLFFRIRVVHEVPGGVVDVRLHVEVTVAAEVEEDG